MSETDIRRILEAIARLEEQIKPLSKLDARVTRVERWMWVQMGAAATAGSGIGVLLAKTLGPTVGS